MESKEDEHMKVKLFVTLEDAKQDVIAHFPDAENDFDGEPNCFMAAHIAVEYIG